MTVEDAIAISKTTFAIRTHHNGDVWRNDTVMVYFGGGAMDSARAAKIAAYVDWEPEEPKDVVTLLGEVTDEGG
jgi:hypothetical protein